LFYSLLAVLKATSWKSRRIGVCCSNGCGSSRTEVKYLAAVAPGEFSEAWGEKLMAECRCEAGA